jgi:hypothetical protein
VQQNKNKNTISTVYTGARGATTKNHLLPDASVKQRQNAAANLK